MHRPTKQQIIEEIRRCANENGGEPLGKRRFEAVTDIRESDWIGRYWARWSEAVAEAGLIPNERQARDLTDDEMLEKLARATREEGAYPTVAQMRMKRITDPTFPNSKTVSNRLGARPEQLARLSVFCEKGEEYSDVLGLVRDLVPVVPGSSNGESGGNELQEAVGHVYLMKSGKYYKIGHTKSVGRRAYEVALQLPHKLVTIHSVATDDPVGIERYWHERFANKRLNGEWFDLSAADVAAFKLRRRFM